MTIQTQLGSLFLELVFDGECPMYINPRLYRQHHARNQGDVVADPLTIVHVQSQIMPDVMRIQPIDHLHKRHELDQLEI